MCVSDEIRCVENELDAEIQSLPIWKRGRETVLEGLMKVYSDDTAHVFVQALDARLFEGTDAFQAALGNEDRVRIGALWSLKWAIKYCPEDGSNDAISQEELGKTILLGHSYDTFVDSLNFAKKGLCALSANRESKEIICYEGNDLTGFDADIVEKAYPFESSTTRY